MRELADFLLKGNGVEIPVSPPVVAGPGASSSSTTNRLSLRRLRLGFSRQDADAAGRLVGHDTRLVTNIHLPGRQVGRLRVLDVDRGLFHLLVEISFTG